MRRSMLMFCSAIAVAGFAAPLIAHEPKSIASASTGMSSAASEAAAVVAAFHTALRTGDTKAAAALLAGDALIYESGGVERSKAEYAAHHLPADAALAKGVVRTVTGQSGDANGDMAWIATESRMNGSYKGRAIDSASTETMVLRREGKDWKIVHIHWSSGK